MKEEICVHCKAVRNKRCVPWRECKDCGGTICRRCRPAYMEPQCNACWHEERNRKREKEMNTPVVCVVCNVEKLTSEMSNPYEIHSEHFNCKPKCTECAEKEVRLQELSRKENAVEGLVEVVYGEHPVPEEDGGKGYAYYSAEKIRLGDVVQVPQTWLDSFKGEGGKKLATVVSTYSDYQGHVSHIIQVVKNGNRRKRRKIKA